MELLVMGLFLLGLGGWAKQYNKRQDVLKVKEKSNPDKADHLQRQIDAISARVRDIEDELSRLSIVADDDDSQIRELEEKYGGDFR